MGQIFMKLGTKCQPTLLLFKFLMSMLYTLLCKFGMELYHNIFIHFSDYIYVNNRKHENYVTILVDVWSYGKVLKPLVCWDCGFEIR